MTGSTLFADAMALRKLSEGVYQGELNSHWTIGPKLHGGAMLALCANAARLAHGGLARSDPGSSGEGHGETVAGQPAAQPIAVAASYLSAPDPGPMRVHTHVRKRGRRISVIDAELTQGDRTAVHAVVTLGEPEHAVPPLLAVNPVAALMAPEPPPGVESIGPGHPLASINHLAAGCDIRPLMSTVPTELPPDGRAPVIQIWVRPRDETPDALFALVCGDISVPVSFALGRRGWAPTVQLTAYLRGMPADGWLRVICSTTQIGQDWFDEDHTVVDCEGRIVVQTRQLAMVPER
jgi:acyl-coenzyme A thioesterase PaaI-like protein